MAMRRRDFMKIIGGSAAWPIAVSAQQPDRMRRIAVLGTPGSDPEAFTAFQQQLQKMGWIEGRNVRLDPRFASRVDDIRVQAAELVASTRNVILGTSNLAATALGQQTRVIPIVFAAAGDPVGTGLEGPS